MPDKPHADEAGFLDSRQSAGGKTVILYDAREAGFDAADGAYVVYCTAHGDLDQGDSITRARTHMRQPTSWCRGCSDAATNRIPGVRPVPFALKTPAEQAREIKLAARTLGADQEKAELFEAIYGVSVVRVASGASAFRFSKR